MATTSTITSDDEKVQTDIEMTSAEEHHVIEIQELTEEHQPESETFDARISCCVFRVPQSFINSNGPNAYRPDIISIGPYHHRKSQNSQEEHKHNSHDLQLQMFEQHKWRYLRSLVSRTERAKVAGLANYVKDIQSQADAARNFYSETIDLNKKEFVEMMVLDGCFIIELFLKVKGVVPFDDRDPISSMSWVLPCLARDLLKLENQIPWFVLQSLFNKSKIPGETTDASFAKSALNFFRGPMPMLEKAYERYNNDEVGNERPKHLLDFIRSCFIPKEPPTNSKYPGNKMIDCVTKLRRAGIKCKYNNTGDSPPMSNSFLDIKFKKHALHGVIEMPSIKIDDVTTAFLLNCVAYEQCYRTTPKHAYFTAYATFMDCLINTREDVGLLCDDDVIENYLGHDKEVAKFFNKFGKDVAVNINECHLSKVFNDVNEYYKNNWHVNWATFRHKYFDSPWSFISLVAAVLLLLLTLAQTLFTAYDYYQSRKG